jgi:hypothetical protein
MAKSSSVLIKQAVNDQLIKLLEGGQAHATFDQAIARFPAAFRGKRPRNVPYSGWQLLEHIRLAQRDILEFATNNDGEGYKPMNWPDDYWPKNPQPPSASAWDSSIKAVHRDLKTFEKLLTAKSANLAKPFAWGDGQNLLRQALLLADHNAYHVGEIVFLRRLLGCWK